MFSSIKQKIKELRRGISLIEVSIVLGIVGIVVGGIWVATAAVYENNKQNQTITDIISMTSNIRQRFPINFPCRCATGSGSVSGYTFADAPAACNFLPKKNWEGVIPATVTTSNAYPVHAWGGDIYIEFSCGIGGTISFYLSTIKSSTCASLGPKLARAFARESNLMVMNYLASSPNQDVKTPALAATNCYADASGSADLSVSFTK